MQSQRLLFVENHGTFASIVMEQFLSNYQVTRVPSVGDAREAMKASEYVVALVDYDLDDDKGDVFVRELRAAGNDIPIIAVSSHSRGNSILIDAGANAICSKMKFSNIGAVIEGLIATR